MVLHPVHIITKANHISPSHVYIVTGAWHTDIVNHLTQEEEHPLPVRSGDDPRAGVAQPHCSVAARCDQVTSDIHWTLQKIISFQSH